MKRMMIAAAAALGVFAGSASADPGGYAPPGPAAGGASAGPIGAPGTLFGPGMDSGTAPDRFGFHPLIKKLFHKGGCSSCGGGQDCGKNPLRNPGNWGAGGYGQNGPAYNPGGFPPGAYGPNVPMQGTLVFPHQPFVRSPRDYFMLDLNK